MEYLPFSTLPIFLFSIFELHIFLLHRLLFELDYFDLRFVVYYLLLRLFLDCGVANADVVECSLLGSERRRRVVSCWIPSESW